MGQVNLDEELVTPDGDGPGTGTFFPINTSPTTPGFVNDIGGLILLSSGISRSTSLGAAPTSPSLRWLDQGGGNPDILYASMKKGDDTWDWVEVIRAPN